MFSRTVAVRLLIPAATLVAEKTELKCKPSELPIYTQEQPKEPVKVVREPGALEIQIGKIRKEVVSYTKQITVVQDKIVDFYEEGKGQVKWLIDYLQEEDNTTPRAGAIAIGGLAGFILALRGGAFRKLVFTSAGALGMAAICYPTEAKEYTHEAIKEAKRYLDIAHNFYYGVQKDDKPLELPSLPKFPSPTELWNRFGMGDTKDKTVSDKATAEVIHTEVKENRPLQDGKATK